MLNPFSNRKAIRNGEPARAWVRRMHALPDEDHRIPMTLDIERADGSRYDVDGRWMVADEASLSVGSEVRVLIDRECDEHIAIDWDETCAIYRRKTDERRRALMVGVPQRRR